MEHAVEVHDAVVLLDRFPALAGLSLTLDPGTVTLVQGPNGAGKTTLLRMIAGLASCKRFAVTEAVKVSGRAPFRNGRKNIMSGSMKTIVFCVTGGYAYLKNHMVRI